MTTTTTAQATGTYIALEVFTKSQHRTRVILFADEAQALAWDERHPWTVDGVRSDTYLVGEASNEDGSGPLRGARWVDADRDPQLYVRLYPTCEHGLSAHLCYGPQHYPMDHQL